MGFFENIFKRNFPEWEQTISEKREPKKRGFQSGQVTRLNKSFTGSSTSINADIKQSIDVMRARSRFLAENDPYCVKYLRTIEKYVIGPEGFTHRNKSYNLVKNDKQKWIKQFDTVANGVIQDGFWDWSKRKYCTVNEDQSLRQFLGTLLKTRETDGEIFINKIYVDNKINPFGFTLQAIEAHYCDHNLNKKLPNGNLIVMGIEYNPLGKAEAYYFRKITLDQDANALLNVKEYIRIPAFRIYHFYRKEFTNQRRGFPTFASVANRIHSLKGYEDAALDNARAAAMRTNMLEPVAGGDESEITEVDISGGKLEYEDGEEVIVQNIAPGETYIVPQGYKHVDYDPAYPQGEHKAFTENMLYGISSGLDIDYPTISSNLSGVNYTSSRHGLLDARTGYRKVQSDIREDLLEPIHTDWLESSILNGYFSLPMPKFNKFNQPMFFGFVPDWVDPLKDKKAEILGIQAKIDTLEEVLSRKGKDLTEHLDQLEYEKEELERRGLTAEDILSAENYKDGGEERKKRLPLLDEYDLIESINEIIEGKRNNGNH
jgi:lambda family phage portal protein